MRIGIIGAGNVGRALGGGWIRVGHDVAFAVREPDAERYRDLAAEATVGGAAAAVALAEVVVLATPWDATHEAIRSCGEFAGRIVVDCTNPLRADLTGLTHGFDDSGGEQVARWAEGARVVKAFNSVGSNIMRDPHLEGRRAVMFIAGDEEGKPVVRELSEALGFDTVDAGPIESARLLEPLAMLWITCAYPMGMGRDFALSMVRRDPGA